MKKTLFIVGLILILSSSCRKPYTCTCTIIQPNLANVITNVTIDNTQVKAINTCNSIPLAVAGTATTVCYIEH